VTRYLKRLRKAATGHPLRYLVCFERHKSGAWHVHMLLHSSENGVLTTRLARKPWTAGFSDAKVADLRAAGYVTKYVTKDLADESSDRVPRIRASRDPRYGAAVMCHEEGIIAQLQKRPEVHVTDLWRANLRMAQQYLVEQEKGTARVWQQIMAGQDAPPTVKVAEGLVVNVETGEILPTKRKSR